ncbi:MAG: phosphotransferase [Pseudomonadota bacterium]|nr:phosphotransferase [Pseudomonadota bacterium]
MAVPTSHDPSIEAALDQWRQWTLGDTYERPSLGELLGEGSANCVYELLPMRQQVLRFAHKSHELSVNPSRQEIELWELAANEGLAPAVYYHSDGGDVVITDHLSFRDVSHEAHAELCKQIHHLRPGRSRLRLTEVAATYRAAANERSSHIASETERPSIRRDLLQLDSESPVFCHNDLSSYNMGWLGDRLLAIDWEYAAMGSPHYDVASASEGMKHIERQEFAMRVLEDTFDKNLWSTACRVVPLINYLWALATEDHDTALSLRAVFEEHYLT